MKPFRIATAAGSAVLLALVTACSAGSGTQTPGSTAGGSGAVDTSLTVGLVAEPASLDFTTKDGAAIPQALLYNVYETLVKIDQDGAIAPALASKWSISDDGKTYTFDLVPNAKFTNGAAFTAKDAAFSINRVKSDWTISLKSSMDVVSEATAVSDTQLKVTLSKPSNNWLYKMTTRVGA
ncbi:MAG: ABC transporter substrate-binding protein, partial [Dermatophilaceae bacterium]